MVGDPIYELNFKNGTLWNDYVWEYTKEFTTPAAARGGDEVLLVLDGIKMGVRDVTALHAGAPTLKLSAHLRDNGPSARSVTRTCIATNVHLCSTHPGH